MNEKVLEFLLSRHSEELIKPDLNLVGQQLAVNEGRIDLLFRTSNSLLVVEVKKDSATTRAVDQVVRYRDDLASTGETCLKALIVAHNIPKKVADYASSFRVDTIAVPHDVCFDLMNRHGYTESKILLGPLRRTGVLQSSGTKPRAPIANEEAFQKLAPNLRTIVEELCADHRYTIVSGKMHTLIHYRSIKLGGINRLSPRQVFISSGLVISKDIELKLTSNGFRFEEKKTTTGRHSWWGCPYSNDSGIRAVLG